MMPEKVPIKEWEACRVLCGAALGLRKRKMIYQLCDIWGGEWTVSVTNLKRGSRRPPRGGGTRS